MYRVTAYAYDIGHKSGEDIFHNHFTSTQDHSPVVKSKIASMGLSRVAGNVFLCPSSRDLWSVKGGKIVKLSPNVVDNGEHAVAPMDSDPENFLDEALKDLTL